jgi:hypothetical protein
MGLALEKWGTSELGTPGSTRARNSPSFLQKNKKQKNTWKVEKGMNRLVFTEALAKLLL